MKATEHTVVIVEDDEDLREGMAFLLARRGHKVVTAGDGREAVERLDQMEQPPCMIILDLMMPEMDGWQVRQWLLRSPSLAAVPVVLVSGVADVDEAARTMSVIDYLRKPVDFDKLYHLLSAHC
jgi:two-component system, chemotaxis family, chemotaxis protein CheY